MRIEIYQKDKKPRKIIVPTSLIFSPVSFSLFSASTMEFIKIDGADRGMIAEPFSIYTLSQGAHSYSIDFYFPGKGEHFYTKEEMLVFNNENAYVSFKSLMYSPSMGLTFERNVYDMKSGYGEDYEKNQSAMRKFASDAYKYNTYDSFSKFENELKKLYRF